MFWTLVLKNELSILQVKTFKSKKMQSFRQVVCNFYEEAKSRMQRVSPNASKKTQHVRHVELQCWLTNKSASVPPIKN